MRSIQLLCINVILSLLICCNISAAFAIDELDANKAMQLLDAADAVAGAISPNNNFNSYWEFIESLNISGADSIYDYPYTKSEMIEKHGTVKQSLDFEGVSLHITKDELYDILRSVFSKEISDFYFENVFKIKLRDSDGGGLKFREKDGILFDCGALYGGQIYGGERPIPKSFSITGDKEAHLIVKYRLWDNLSEQEYSTHEYEFVLQKESDGRWVFSDYIPINDYDYLNMRPDNEEYYPKNWLNPNTSDSAVYITAAAGVIALCCAVICKKKITE